MTRTRLDPSNPRTRQNRVCKPVVMLPAADLRTASGRRPSRLPENTSSLQPARAPRAFVNVLPTLSRISCAIQAEFKQNLPRRLRANASLQQKAAAGTPPFNLIQPKLTAGVEAFRVNLQQSAGGWPLPKEVQAKMESALGADFSDVRIHVGSEVPAIGAIAFTWGSNIHFAPGYYNPNTLHGQRLLAHELTHVVQQRAGRVRNPYGSGVAVVQDHALEAEADRMALRALTTPPSQSTR
ncbi:MAG: DUF4157 domain-containing protein [Terriglobia bacterium]